MRFFKKYFVTNLVLCTLMISVFLSSCSGTLYRVTYPLEELKSGLISVEVIVHDFEINEETLDTKLIYNDAVIIEDTEEQKKILETISKIDLPLAAFLKLSRTLTCFSFLIVLANLAFDTSNNNPGTNKILANNSIKK